MTAADQVAIANKWVHNPGSKEAVEKGCLCPVIDNCHGKGAYGGAGFYKNPKCEMHSTK